MNNEYIVTRQAQWMGDLMVEISEGGFDYVNPDMLSEKYDGEGQSFSDPREAVKIAIEIFNSWRKDQPDECIGISYGCTLGFCMPFEAEEIKDIKVWAEKEYEALPKCDRCGDIIEEEYKIDYLEDSIFCSEYCAEETYNDMFNEEE